MLNRFVFSHAVTKKKGGAGHRVMATSEVLTQSERGALDNVLRPHLRLEPVQEPQEPSDHGMYTCTYVGKSNIGKFILLWALQCWKKHTTGTGSSPAEKQDGTNSRRISGGSRMIMSRSRSKSMECNRVRSALLLKWRCVKFVWFLAILAAHSTSEYSRGWQQEETWGSEEKLHTI